MSAWTVAIEGTFAKHVVRVAFTTGLEHLLLILPVQNSLEFVIYSTCAEFENSTLLETNHPDTLLLEGCFNETCSPPEGRSKIVTLGSFLGGDCVEKIFSPGFFCFCFVFCCCFSRTKLDKLAGSVFSDK